MANAAPITGAPLRASKIRPRGVASPAFDLLPRIERACADRNILPSRFGRRATNDPQLIYDIRKGRRLRAETRDRIETYLRRLERLASMKGEG